MQRLSFENWMKVVSALVAHKIGLSCADLDDAPYRDWYDEGLTAIQAARRTERSARDLMGNW